jgi:hypothetical protein
MRLWKNIGLLLKNRINSTIYVNDTSIIGSNTDRIIDLKADPFISVEIGGKVVEETNDKL